MRMTPFGFHQRPAVYGKARLSLHANKRPFGSTQACIFGASVETQDQGVIGRLNEAFSGARPLAERRSAPKETTFRKYLIIFVIEARIIAENCSLNVAPAEASRQQLSDDGARKLRSVFPL